MAFPDAGSFPPRPLATHNGLIGMVFSPQQIKFEFLSYIKEFGEPASSWRVGCSANAEAALAEEQRIDLDRDLWIWKPTLSPAAARLVHRFFTNQFNVQDAGVASDGANVFLFMRRVTEDASLERSSS